MITGGGTAGHTNPGIAIGEALVAAGVDRDRIRFVGGRRGNEEELVTAAGFRIDTLPGRGIPRSVSLGALKAAAELTYGTLVGFWSVLRHRPAAVVCLGGYAAVAVSLAAVLLRVPVVVSEQNARASAVNRLIGRWARVCALPFPDTDLPNGVVTGNPIRQAVVDAVVGGDRATARRRLDLPADRVVVAVWSGSLGATSVNTATRELVEGWAGRSDLAVRHIVGRRDWDRFATPPELDGLLYQLVEYETAMPDVLVAADVAVCRSGASTVAELAVAGLPTVLVPLPNAPRDHQRANAAELVEAGGARLLDDGDLDGPTLAGRLEDLVDDGNTRRVMARAAASVGRPDAAAAVARLVVEAAGIDITRIGAARIGAARIEAAQIDADEAAPTAGDPSPRPDPPRPPSDGDPRGDRR
ncbi:MAG: UDP-N-acetylglucosamine--N-acetylmuramyl-(pentapeptide) pyrophosphoryl-undecaprenol N-acetylglucosamine transferase [Acidimicrobiales bacterium]